MNKQKNKNYQRINNIIINSFIALCKEEGAKSISVSMLCKTADINRTTFYNHFKDIWEIIELIDNEIMIKINDILEDFTFANFIRKPYNYLKQINNIIEENPKYYQTLFELSESKFFMEKLKEILKEKIMKDKDFLRIFGDYNNAQSAASFFIGGLANVYGDWLNKKIDCSLDEIVFPMSKSIIKFFN